MLIRPRCFCSNQVINVVGKLDELEIWVQLSSVDISQVLSILGAVVPPHVFTQSVLALSNAIEADFIVWIGL